jgi:PD-(D/E)XK nuclease superfamily
MTTDTTSKPIIEISYSSMNEIHSCARKYQIRKRFEHSQSNWDASIASMGGNAIHRYIQAIAAGMTTNEADIEFFYAWDFNVEVADSQYNRDARGMEACLISAKHAVDALGINPENVARIVTGGISVPAIEVKANIILNSSSWVNEYHYRLAIDLIMHNKLGDTYSVYDIKSHRDTSTLPLDYKYRYDLQTVPYGLVVAEICGKSIDSFQAHYLPIFVDSIQPRSEIINFTRTHSDLEHWLDATKRQIEQIEQYYMRDVWPRTTTGCDAYRKPCKYFKYCHIENPYQLQLALTAFGPPKKAEPFGEIITLHMDL